ncbi:MAG TPA: hypothetical protein VKN99_06355 [Polyangia bacterium]|nr:hypothetical protein [Polyangia bacterium]
MKPGPCLLMLVVAAALGCVSGPKPRPLPPGLSFDGRWDSNFHEMSLHQQGTKVWGTVNYRDGALEGTLDGDVLRFQWHQRENRQHGRGYLQMSADGQHLEGRWGYDTSDDDGGRWWADRAEGAPTPTETEPRETVTPAPAPASD